MRVQLNITISESHDVIGFTRIHIGQYRQINRTGGLDSFQPGQLHRPATSRPVSGMHIFMRVPPPG